MARLPDKHPDPIVRDLLAIRRLRWSRPEDFRVLETLLTHPLIDHFAYQPKRELQRVKELKAALEEVVRRIREDERDEPPDGRSVAEAATALLHLSEEFTSMSLGDIRIHIASRWSKAGKSLSPDGFRQHLEVTHVFEPLADEFRLFAHEQSQDYSKPIPLEIEVAGNGPPEIEFEESGDVGPAPETVADGLRAVERALYQQRLADIDAGIMAIRSEEEMVNVLIMLTKTATEEFRAVDHNDVSEWFSSLRLNHYLTTQLKRTEIDLLRIRIIRPEELEYGSRSREQLQGLIELHDEAGAKLLLCRDSTAKELDLKFAPHVGFFMIDPDTAPAAVTGKLAGDGSIGKARAYIGDGVEMRSFQKEFETLQQTALLEDPKLRDELAWRR